MNLKQYIEKTGTTVHALAKRAGVTPSTVYKFINGEQRSIKPHIARAISEATGGEVGILDLLFPGERVKVNVEVVKE